MVTVPLTEMCQVEFGQTRRTGIKPFCLVPLREDLLKMRVDIGKNVLVLAAAS